MRWTKQKCQVCKESFKLEDLYPASLMRSSTFAMAQKELPSFDKNGYICFEDLRKIRAQLYQEVLSKEKGILSELEKEVLESIDEQDILSENINEEFEENLTFGERLSDKIAHFGGSWTFITFFGLLLFTWMGMNSYALLSEPFDPYPFILLNLVLSTLAAIQAPIIMMSQNRQASKDRYRQENDYQVNLKSELQIRQLNARLDHLMKHHWHKMHQILNMQEEILEETEREKRNGHKSP